MSLKVLSPHLTDGLGWPGGWGHRWAHFCISESHYGLGAQSPVLPSPGLKAAITHSTNPPSDPSPGLLPLNLETKLATVGSVKQSSVKQLGTGQFLTQRALAFAWTTGVNHIYFGKG